MFFAVFNFIIIIIIRLRFFFFPLARSTLQLSVLNVKRSFVNLLDHDLSESLGEDGRLLRLATDSGESLGRPDECFACDWCAMFLTS